MPLEIRLFESALNSYLRVYSDFLTEDIVRQIFICTHVEAKEIECPYLSCTGCTTTPIKANKIDFATRPRADLYCEDEVNGKTESWVIEFKYNKMLKYSQNCYTRQRGLVFADINQLALLKNDKKYFVYVMDNAFYVKVKNKLDIVNPALIGKVLSSSIFTGKNYSGKEFDKNAFKPFNTRKSFKSFSYELEMLYYRKLINDFHLFVYEIR